MFERMCFTGIDQAPVFNAALAPCSAFFNGPNRSFCLGSFAALNNFLNRFVESGPRLVW